MDKKPDDRITELEEALAYLTRVTDDLSEVIARQDQDISRLTRRLDMLMRAEAERQSQSDGSIAVADQPPPHCSRHCASSPCSPRTTCHPKTTLPLISLTSSHLRCFA